jgi:acyl-CoA thioesterase
VNAATAEELAERCATRMLERDHASRGLGMRIEAAEPGNATVSMLLTSDMCNGHGTAHGGIIFTLADSAFAFACNSRDVASVAQHCTITFVSPGRSGERLVASAREISLAGRFGIYDVVVRGADARTVAIFQGNSAAIRGSVLEPS